MPRDVRTLPALRPYLMPDVLWILQQAVRLYGQLEGEDLAAQHFVQWCYDVAHANVPTLRPFPEEQ